MRSGTSSKNLKTSCLLSWRLIRENTVWMVLLSSIFLLSQPFLYYLSGFAANPFQDQEEFSFDQIGFLFTLQNIFSAILLLIALSFLLYRLSSFFYQKKQSDLFYSLPVSRGLQFSSISVAAVVIISLPFLLNRLGMLLAFSTGGARSAELLALWSQSWMALFLDELAYFFLGFALLALVGRLGDGLAFILLFEGGLPLTFFLILAYVRQSLPVLACRGRLSQSFLLACLSLSPLPGSFMPRDNKAALALRLLTLFVFILLAFLAFLRRPVERTEQKLSEHPAYGVIEAFCLLLFGLLGGQFFELIFNRQTVFLYLLGFIAFILPARYFFAFFSGEGGNPKVVWQRGRRGLALVLGLFICFAFICDLLPRRSLIPEDFGTPKKLVLMASGRAAIPGIPAVFLGRMEPFSGPGISLTAEQDKEVIDLLWKWQKNLMMNCEDSGRSGLFHRTKLNFNGSLFAKGVEALVSDDSGRTLRLLILPNELSSLELSLRSSQDYLPLFEPDLALKNEEVGALILKMPLASIEQRALAADLRAVLEGQKDVTLHVDEAAKWLELKFVGERKDRLLEAYRGDLREQNFFNKEGRENFDSARLETLFKTYGHEGLLGGKLFLEELKPQTRDFDRFWPETSHEEILARLYAPDESGKVLSPYGTPRVFEQLKSWLLPQISQKEAVGRKGN